MSFATAINCMDGRTQLPVIEYMSDRLGVDYVDMVTEAGPVRTAADSLHGALSGSIIQRVVISVEEHGSTTQQWAVLGALSHDSAEAGMTVGELAAFLLVSRQNLTGLLSRLEKQGLTERSRDSADGRSRRIKLSAKGRTLWRDQLVPEIVAYYKEALAGIPEGEQARFLTLLGQLLDNLKALDERP